MSIGGGGQFDRNRAQELADELRDDPATPMRWDRAMWVRFGMAAIVLVAVIVAVAVFGR
ncbi:MAG: hypothetical protein JWM34_4184 [Ilumatobacteraceae bacterium]|nr:hypothetical protein [Ilumatobacteraceae bacterium]